MVPLSHTNQWAVFIDTEVQKFATHNENKVKNSALKSNVGARVLVMCHSFQN